MSREETVLIGESDPLIRDKLADLLEKTGFSGGYAFVESDVGLDLNAMAVPIRVGVILDRLAAENADEDRFAVGPYALDVTQHVLILDDVRIRLTEKESALLRILHDAGGQSIGRRDLLDQVWGYHADVETHTIETHIYRLRQKIEVDSAAPRILMTDDDGYFLNLK